MWHTQAQFHTGKESKKPVSWVKYLYHFPKPTITASLDPESLLILLLYFPVKMDALDFCKEINFLSSEFSYLSDKNLLGEIV